MRKIIFITIPAILLLLLVYACSSSPVIPLYEYPPDWKDKATREKTIADYSKYLSGRKIFLDPGHGGEDRKNKNKDGSVIEADVNLRVALNLKKYLEEAGAQVFISREIDKTVALALRSELANQSGAEIFISIHHNAPSKVEDDYTNYTAVYYHAKQTDYEYEPCNHDLARYIERDLSYVMRNPGGLGSFDGTYSDYNIYPGEGFSVLRKTNIPAVLVECAFHTSHFEELRLNNEEFNQIQAWGIFRGVAKYLRAGKPEINILADSSKIENNLLKVSLMLTDSSGIDPRSIQVFFNKEEKEFSFDKLSGIVNVKIDLPIPGEYALKVVAANKNGNYSFPFHKKIIVSDLLEPEIID
ncbi:MAG: N-acetylmuramoyl-L-alanine amidase [Ignavibacteriales bacterium]|nr:N-acetylmuramoyl-L-alanine amidase [Ignavibacteriales bacterium]